MKRLSLLTILLAAACGKKEDEPRGGGATEAPDQPRPELVSPPTGVSKIRESYELWLERVEELEERAAAAAADGSRAPSEAEVAAAIRGARNTLAAVERAVAEEAKQLREARYVALREEQAAVRSELNGYVAEIAEVQAIVQEIEGGLRAPPAGHTLAELQDRLGDLDAEVRRLRAREGEITEQMRRMDAERESGASAPEVEESLLVLEREAVRALVKRAEALESR